MFKVSDGEINFKLTDAQSSDELAPLASWPVMRAAGRESLEDNLRTIYGATLVAAEPGAQPFSAEANRVQIGDLTLHYCRYDAPVEIQFLNMAGMRQLLCLSGDAKISSAGRHVEINPETTTIIPVNSAFEASYSAGYQQIVMQFDEAALGRKAEAILGTSLRGPLDLTVMQALPTASRLRSREIAGTLGRILATQSRIDLPVVELSQTLGTAFLFENVMEFRSALAKEPKSASIAQVRVLEDYIQANWNQPLTVEDIAAACGVSVRSVFARFKQHRGIAPLTYLRELRLDQAHHRLLSEADESVISIAMACGFSSFGYFARRYRDRFGELPSTTRARSRAL